MPIQHALAAAAAFPHIDSFRTLKEQLPSAWVDAALGASGVATVRRRRLPLEQVVWLVLGIALFRDCSIEEVVDRLEIALPSPLGAIAKSAIPPARMRLGALPLQYLFERTGGVWSHASAARHRWRGLSLYGMDGTSLRVADTKKNREEFGGWATTAKKVESSTPIVRLVVLMALRSHLLVSARFGPYAQSAEINFAREMISEIPPRSLTIIDALYLSASFLLALQDPERDRHWLTKAKSNTSMRVVESLGPRDDIVEMKVSDEARAQGHSLPRVWRARRITFQRPGFPQRTLLTSMMDAVAYPAEEVIELYHERWEIELGYDELKTEMLNAEVTLRSKSPEAVKQELWGVLVGFNLVRLEMERIAEEARVLPTRISFVTALHLIRYELDWCATTRSPGNIPKHLARMRERLKRLILPKRRSTRRYPRALKTDTRRYPRKKTAAAAEPPSANGGASGSRPALSKPAAK